jgi:hypothetical protein
VAHRLLIRDLRRLGRLTTRDGPRFSRVHENEWLGWTQREVPRPALRGLAAEPSATSPKDTTVVYRGVSVREAKRLWVMANLLARRGLGAAPLALLHRRGEVRLLLETSNLRPTPEEGATGARSLRRRLAAWGDPPEDLPLSALAWTQDPRGRPLALLRGPRGFSLRFQSLGASSDKRAHGNARRWHADPFGDGR